MKLFSKSKLLILWGSVLISLYLTGIINERTLTTDLQRVFVFVYMFFAVGALIYSWYKCIINVIGRKQILVCLNLAMLIALGITIVSSRQVLPKIYLDNYITITPLKEKNHDSQGYEIWISSVKLDGKNIDFDDHALNEIGWLLNGTTLYTNASEEVQPMVLYAPKGKTLEVQFARHPWSGSVNISCASFSEQYDLYDSEGTDLVVNIPVHVEPYTGIIQILLWIGLLCLNCFITFVVLSWGVKNKGIFNGTNIILLICMLCALGTICYMNSPNR